MPRAVPCFLLVISLFSPRVLDVRPSEEADTRLAPLLNVADFAALQLVLLHDGQERII